MSYKVEMEIMPNFWIPVSTKYFKNELEAEQCKKRLQKICPKKIRIKKSKEQINSNGWGFV